MMSLFSLSPAILEFLERTMPPSESTAMSVVPPPMSMIMEPTGSLTGRRMPMADAIGSSMMYTSRAPADFAASYTARISTLVMPDGTPTTTLGRKNFFEIFSAFAIRYDSISSVTS